MGRAEKVVLAYSGGVDTTVCIPYLRQEWGVQEVITLAVDVGQGVSLATAELPETETRRQQELEAIRVKALAAGASVSIVKDVRAEFVQDYALPALKANALYEGRYPLSTALARPLIAKLLVEVAEEYGADGVAHGCTGKGNDQVRFDVSIAALNPKLKVLAPAREWGMSREETMAYGERFGLTFPVKKSSPYSIDSNLLGQSIEAGPLEDPWFEPPEEIYSLTQSVEHAPDRPEYVTLEFHQGEPVALNGEPLAPVALMERLNLWAGAAWGGAAGHDRKPAGGDQVPGDLRSTGVVSTDYGAPSLGKSHPAQGCDPVQTGGLRTPTPSWSITGCGLVP